MSEMVERVARAILAAMREGDKSAYVGEMVAGDKTLIDGEFDMSVVGRAAIAAMNPPTEAMVQAGIAEGGRAGYDYTADTQVCHPARSWAVMIDAALSPDSIVPPV